MDPTPFKSVEPVFACAHCGQSHGSQPCLGGIDLESSDVLESALSASATSLSNEGSRTDPLANSQYVGGRYEVLELLGQGGMGAVYKVNHQALNKIFALKALNPGVMTDQKALRRFDAEAKAVGNLSSPYLIQVHDYGLTDSGTPYLVLDFVEGTNLADEIKRLGHIEEKRALDIFSKVCEGLEHAHHNKIVHRDLKPSNIMLTKDANGNEIPKIVDFGIAKRQAVENTLTQTGEIFGTPLYMSPEQCLGKPIDNRTDIYSLGCVMYEALTGTPPLSGQNPIETVLKHVNDSPAPLRKQCKNWTVSAETEQVVMSCLEKEPGRRPNSAADLQQNLKRISKGKKPQLRRLLPRLKQNQVMLIVLLPGLTALVMLAFILLCGGFLWQMHQDRPLYEKEIEQSRAANNQGDFKTAIKFGLKAIEDGKSTMPLLRKLDAYNSMAEIYNSAQELELSSEYYEKAATLAHQNNRDDLTFNGYCAAADKTGRRMRKIELNEKAVASWPKSSKDVDALMHVLLNLSHVHCLDNSWDIAEERLKYALSVIQKNPTVHKTNQMRVHEWLGAVYSHTERPAQALASFQAAQKLAEEQKFNEYLPSIKREEAHVLRQLGRTAEADRLSRIDSDQLPLY
jgi:serine/threonine protein kinase